MVARIGKINPIVDDDDNDEVKNIFMLHIPFEEDYMSTRILITLCYIILS